MIHTKIKVIDTYNELRKIATIRSEIWPNDGAVALDHMKFISQHGGIVLGAYLQENLVGYVYSFPGYKQNQVYLILQNICILPSYQQQKIGEALMKRLKEEAKLLGYQEMVWTFEPLESVNAYVYLHKMGATSSVYIRNCYENDQDNMPIDRFFTRWHIAQSYEPPSYTFEDLKEKAYNIQLSTNSSTSLLSFDPEKLEKNSFLLIPVPANFSVLPRQKAYEWRIQTQPIFEQIFKRGWEVFDLIKNPHSEQLIHYYSARKRSI